MYTCQLFVFLLRYTGGNQRELARQKHAKKQNEQGKGKRNEDGLSAAARKQRYVWRLDGFTFAYRAQFTVKKHLRTSSVHS